MGGEIEDRLRGAVAGDSVCSLCEDMWEKYYGAVKHYTEQTFPAQISRFQQTQTHRPAPTEIFHKFRFSSLHFLHRSSKFDDYANIYSIRYTDLRNI